ncbi:MAG: MFS transporter, partial [Mycobacterium sp.]
KLIAEGVKYRTAFAMQYGEMFSITAIVCVVGAVLALFISGRNEHADVDGDSAGALRSDPPTEAVEQTASSAEPPGQHRR